MYKKQTYVYVGVYIYIYTLSVPILTPLCVHIICTSYEHTHSEMQFHCLERTPQPHKPTNP